MEQGSTTLKGIAGAPGIASGQIYVLYADTDFEHISNHPCDDPAEEIRLFHEAIEHVRQEFQELKQRMAKQLPTEELMIFEAYERILKSHKLTDGVEKRINTGSSVHMALRDTINEQIRLFQSIEDPYLRERAEDIRHLGLRILHWLHTNQHKNRNYPAHTILVGEDITIGQISDVPHEKLVGIISQKGSNSSHTAILARAAGIPAIMSVHYLPLADIDQQTIYIDGYQGLAWLKPNYKQKRQLQRLLQEEKILSRHLKADADKPAITRDGKYIPLYLNGGLYPGFKPTLSANAYADGVGLFRTEYPFFSHTTFPDEQQQCNIYRTILKSFSPKPVTLRILDIGGDKILPYFPIEEDNPFLGWRGIRVMLSQPDIFRTQLRAILLASEGLKNLRILFPMLAFQDELLQCKAMLQQAWQELKAEGHEIHYPDIGAMIEVPSAVYLVNQFAPEVDFISIGSNDLIQYLLAVDRNNAHVAHLYQPLHPAVIWVLKFIIDNSHEHGIEVGLCGEMASDPVCALLLLGLDIDHLSISAASLPAIKLLFCRLDYEETKVLVQQAREIEDATQVRQLLEEKILALGLGGLIHPGQR